MSDSAFLDEDEEGTELLGARMFEAPGKRRTDRAFVLVVAGEAAGRLVQLDGESFVIGRSELATLTVPDEGLSRAHARLFRRGGMLWVEDLGSTNGTSVNGARILDAVPLKDGDRVRLGGCELISFSVPPEHADEFHGRVYRAATRDPLLGVFRRHVMIDRIAEETAYAKRRGASLSLIVVELTFGGDELGQRAVAFALRQLADQTLRCVRQEDVVARLGDLRLGILCRTTSRPEALEVAGRLEAEVRRGRVLFEGQRLELAPLIAVVSVSNGDRDEVDLLASGEAAIEAARG